MLFLSCHILLLSYVFLFYVFHHFFVSLFRWVLSILYFFSVCICFPYLSPMYPIFPTYFHLFVPTGFSYSTSFRTSCHFSYGMHKIPGSARGSVDLSTSGSHGRGRSYTRPVALLTPPPPSSIVYKPFVSTSPAPPFSLPSLLLLS